MSFEIFLQLHGHLLTKSVLLNVKGADVAPLVESYSQRL